MHVRRSRPRRRRRLRRDLRARTSRTTAISFELGPADRRRDGRPDRPHDRADAVGRGRGRRRRARLRLRRRATASGRRTTGRSRRRCTSTATSRGRGLGPARDAARSSRSCGSRAPTSPSPGSRRPTRDPCGSTRRSGSGASASSRRSAGSSAPGTGWSLGRLELGRAASGAVCPPTRRDARSARWPGSAGARDAALRGHRRGPETVACDAFDPSASGRERLLANQRERTWREPGHPDDRHAGSRASASTTPLRASPQGLRARYSLARAARAAGADRGRAGAASDDAVLSRTRRAERATDGGRRADRSSAPTAPATRRRRSSGGWRTGRPQDLAARSRDGCDRPVGREHRGDVRVEGVDVGRQQVVGHAERPARRPASRRRSALALGGGQRLEPAVDRDERRVDERRVDPQRQGSGRAPRSDAPCAAAASRVAHRARRPNAWSRFSRAISARRRGRRPVHDPQVRAERPGQARPRVGAEVGVLVDALGDERVRDLEQERARPGAEQQRRLAVEAPAVGARAVEPGVARAVSGRWAVGRPPTTPPGTRRPRRASLTMSTTRNGSRPNSIASTGGDARRDRQPRDADRVDHRGAEGRRAERAADPPVPAQLREPADERRRDDEPDEVAAGRAPDDLAARPCPRRRTAGRRRPSATYSSAAAPPRRRPSAPPTTSTPKFWSVYGTGLPGIVIDDQRASGRSGSHRRRSAARCAGSAGDVRSPTRTGIEEVGDRQALLGGGHARHRRDRVGHRAPRAPVARWVGASLPTAGAARRGEAPDRAVDAPAARHPVHSAGPARRCARPGCPW